MNALIPSLIESIRHTQGWSGVDIFVESKDYPALNTPLVIQTPSIALITGFVGWQRAVAPDVTIKLQSSAQTNYVNRNTILLNMSLDATSTSQWFWSYDRIFRFTTTATMTVTNGTNMYGSFEVIHLKSA